MSNNKNNNDFENRVFTAGIALFSCGFLAMLFNSVLHSLEKLGGGAGGHINAILPAVSAVFMLVGAYLFISRLLNAKTSKDGD
ncbi:MAG: hypothetical protein LBJ20_04530 [Candidatus Methanoplasma sp.]|nr:hypothetical protein [Candidatus Methanoplasma sp.]